MGPVPVPDMAPVLGVALVQTEVQVIQMAQRKVLPMEPPSQSEPVQMLGLAS